MAMKDTVVTATCRLNLFASMAHSIETALKSVHHITDMPQVVAPPDDSHT